MNIKSRFKTLIFILGVSIFLTQCSLLSKKDKRGIEIDHVAVSVSSTHRASQLYGGPFGFSLTQGWANTSRVDNLAAFKDGSYIQLLSPASVNQGIARWYGSWQNSSHPGNFLALRTGDLAALKERATTAGIPFEEALVRGQNGDVLFEAITFKEYRPLSFLVVLQYNDEFYQDYFHDLSHRNGARALQEAWILVDGLAEAQSALSALGLNRARRVILQPFRSHAVSFQLQLGELILVERSKVEKGDLDHLSRQTPSVAGMSFQVNEIERSASRLDRYPHLRYATTRYNGKSCILVPPQYTGGIWLELAR